MHERSEFTMKEAFKTCTFICPEYRLDYVFEREGIEADADQAAGQEAGQKARVLVAMA